MAEARSARTKVKAQGRARTPPQQLKLGTKAVQQAELFEDRPGGRQAPARLRELNESIEAIDSLFYESIRNRGAKVFDEFLAFCRRFNRFSAFNAMLIETQRPGATAIGSRGQWRTIGRQIKPGAVPIAILWPFAPIHWVYELNDTYGRAVPKTVDDPFATKGSVPGASWSATANAADRFGVLVELTDRWGNRLAGVAGLLHGGTDGAVLSTSGRRHRWRVLINGSLDIGARFATLAHELGHIYCGHLGGHPEGFWPDRPTLTEAQREMEAEAVAFLACRRMGLETNATRYLSRHATAENLLAISKRMIIDATNRVEART